MWKRFLVKWRDWEEALGSMDDLQGDYLLYLERRVESLEKQVEILQKRGDPN